MTRRPGRAAMVATATALALGVAACAASPAPGPSPWRPRFSGSEGLVANEHDMSPGAAVVRSPDWMVTSGSFFSDGGAGWSGPIDAGPPDPRSAVRTGSAVLRVVSMPVFDSCSVGFDLLLDSMTSTRRTPPRAFDGVHVFLRYLDPWHLYAVSVARRDGLVVVKRKLARPGSDPSSDSGGYVTLATARWPWRLHEWHHVVATVRDVAGRAGPAVELRLAVDGAVLLDVVDDGKGGGPISDPGRIGLRGDNTEFHVRDLVVVPLP